MTVTPPRAASRRRPRPSASAAGAPVRQGHSGQMGEKKHGDASAAGFLTNLVAGAVSRGIASSLTYPLDRSAAMLRLQGANPALTPLLKPYPGGFLGFVHVIRQTTAVHGWQANYRGVVMHIAKAGVRKSRRGRRATRAPLGRAGARHDAPQLRAQGRGQERHAQGAPQEGLRGLRGGQRRERLPRGPARAARRLRRLVARAPGQGRPEARRDAPDRVPAPAAHVGDAGADAVPHRAGDAARGPGHPALPGHLLWRQRHAEGVQPLPEGGRRRRPLLQVLRRAGREPERPRRRGIRPQASVHTSSPATATRDTARGSEDGPRTSHAVEACPSLPSSVSRRRL